MKNEIGRKITSLTLMTIMFAGGMTLAVPGFMPVATADYSVSSGMITASSEFIQGGAVLEIVINDPAWSATDIDLGDGPDVTYDGTDYIATQASDGKWYAYFVDYSSASALDDDGTGFEYGVHCAGLGTNGTSAADAGGTQFDIIASTVTVFAEAYTSTDSGSATASGDAGHCNNIDGADGSLDSTAATATSGATARELLTDAVLANAPAMSQWDTTNNSDGGQRLHILNASGHGSWPFIFADAEFGNDNIFEYKPSGDQVNVEFGNTDDETWISLANENPSENHQIHLTIGDPALNIDPTSADVWHFNLGTPTNASTKWVNNGSNGYPTDAALLLNGFVDNGYLKTNDLDGDGSADVGNISGEGGFNMTETYDNSGVFESFDINGSSGLTVSEGAAADTPFQFSYGDNNITMVITYNDASMEVEHEGSTWMPGSSATVTITDPDLNKNPGDSDELSIGDETAKVPTIKIGTPVTIGSSGGGLTDGEAFLAASSNAGFSVGNAQGSIAYTGDARTTFDHSERVRLTHITLTDGTSSGTIYGTTSWLNMTMDKSPSAIAALEGTVVLSYDISGFTSELTGVSDIDVFMVNTGTNATTASAGLMTLSNTGAASTAVVSLCHGASDSAIFVCNDDVTDKGTHGTWPDSNGASTSAVNIAFKVTHASGGQASATADYAIAADLCNFDQNNGTDTHNCIYRIDMEETGDDTGVFQGEVEYIMLNNSTMFNGRTTAGVHSGNDHNVEGLITANDDSVTVVLMDGIDGVSALRISHNDTDALQASEEVQKQLDASTHTGTAELDQLDYESEDMATITIIDPDLNQDSEVRETYTNSSTTFQITCTDGSDPEIASQCVSAASTVVIIESSPSSGVFSGTFSVPNELGEDMELTYYESADAAGEELEIFHTATISSNDGDVSLNQSVYPVPFADTELFTGADSARSAGFTDGHGNVTGTIIVSEPDQTTDSLSGLTAGDVTVKLVQTGTTYKMFTAGATSSSDATASAAEELGPLTETERGSMVYEVDFVVDSVQCGLSDTVTSGTFDVNDCATVISGDVLQVEYIDRSDSAGATSTFYDSSTFDLRTGSLSTDKDVYVIGSDMVVTLTDPDLNINYDTVQSWTLDLVEWDSEADSSELLNQTDDFIVNPNYLQETGDDTGVFQTVVEIPSGIKTDATTTKVALDFGEEVTLTYVDNGLAGEDDYGDDRIDVETAFSISNFGALIELNKAVFNWTDTVYVTITAPDHNQNVASEETIGTSDLPIQVTTRAGKMCTTGDKTYKAVETDEDTGVFTSEIQLIGFAHTLSSDSSNTGPHYSGATTCGSGDTDGEIASANQTDGVSVSYEYNDSAVVVASASIVWNIGETSWDTSAVSAGGSGLVTVVDPDENVNDSLVDTFKVDVFSDSDSGGFLLTMNETDEDTGVFEGTVWFTTDLATSGVNLRVSEGDTVTVEYTDETLPEPYTTDDDLTIAATTTVGTAFPPLERAPAANARVVDAFGASVAEVSVDQQVQIAADVTNGQSGDQAFAYLVQVQDGNGVTVSLAWITGSLTAGQSMSPALSWTPSDSGSYTATVFVWESVDNPTALSPTVSVSIDVV